MNWLELIALFAFFSYLFALSWFDWKKKLLPLEPMYVAIVLFFLLRVFQGQALSSFIGILVGAGFIGAQVWLSKGKWMGKGDIWFAASTGAFLGWPGEGVALYLTYIVGGSIAVLLLITGIYKRGMRIPFAPFLTLGAVLSVLWGSKISQWFAERLS
ncbi:prepilin peptidase [Candidatus Uhrbacteria bacterium]|nr:prepilin peptidase [Candidatus Uhrbacteria bacterium]